ncbi:pRL2-11 [Streptomyces triculaminicus]|uniref:pRL2-11 n=1 Tax=Streptomyces triculaminicus TaxID=2816232 RepID=UPI0037D012CE
MARSELDREIEEGAGAFVLGLGRLLSGRDMDGVRRTDATFFRCGSRVLEGVVEGRVGWWSYVAGWQRSGIRLLGLGAAGGVGWGYWADPEQAVRALQYGGVSVGGLVVAGGVMHAVRGRRQRELMREWIEPLHLALLDPLGIPAATRPRSYLHVPGNFSDDDAEIRIDLPVSLQFNEQRVAELVVKKLALQGVSFRWKYGGKDPYVLVKKVHRPPGKVVFSDPRVRELVQNVRESAPLIGLGRGQKVVSVDLDVESPHVLVSAGTGGGKSVILRTIASQLIHHGAHGYILDFKRVSHLWARGVANVTYCRDIADIHEALISLGAEGQRRIHAAEHLGDDEDPSTVGPRIVILLEEINATMKQLARYWEKVRYRDDPKISPAVDALAEILFMGRAVRLHVLLVAQSATARALGGPEMRENFATRILARYTQNAWRMLVPEVHPAPKSTRHIGRAQVVLGGVAQETQVMFMTDAEARDWAMAGVGAESAVTLERVAVPQRPSTPAEPGYLGKHASLAPGDPEISEISAGLGHGTPQAVPQAAAGGLEMTAAAEEPASRAEAEDPDGAALRPVAAARSKNPQQLVTLRKAQEEILPQLTVEALRTARKRDPDFPPHEGRDGQQMLYRVEDLLKWERNRVKSGTG